MKFIIQYIILSIVLSSIFSKSLTKTKILGFAEIGEAFLKTPEALTNALGSLTKIPMERIKDVSKWWKEIKENRENKGYPYIINLTEKPLHFKCVDATAFLDTTIRGNTFLGALNAGIIFASGSSTTIRCRVYIDDVKFGGEHRFEKKKSYSWNDRGATTKEKLK